MPIPAVVAAALPAILRAAAVSGASYFAGEAVNYGVDQWKRRQFRRRTNAQYQYGRKTYRYRRY